MVILFQILTALVNFSDIDLNKDSESDMKLLCRTLRNGFQHFNYEYSDYKSEDYFAQIALPNAVNIKIPDSIKKVELC
jgi:hypothetical protein